MRSRLRGATITHRDVRVQQHRWSSQDDNNPGWRGADRVVIKWPIWRERHMEWRLEIGNRLEWVTCIHYANQIESGVMRIILANTAQIITHFIWLIWIVSSCISRERVCSIRAVHYMVSLSRCCLYSRTSIGVCGVICMHFQAFPRCGFTTNSS